MQNLNCRKPHLHMNTIMHVNTLNSAEKKEILLKPDQITVLDPPYGDGVFKSSTHEKKQCYFFWKHCQPLHVYWNSTVQPQVFHVQYKKCFVHNPPQISFLNMDLLMNDLRYLWKNDASEHFCSFSPVKEKMTFYPAQIFGSHCAPGYKPTDRERSNNMKISSLVLDADIRPKVNPIPATISQVVYSLNDLNQRTQSNLRPILPKPVASASLPSSSSKQPESQQVINSGPSDLDILADVAQIFGKPVASRLDASLPLDTLLAQLSSENEEIIRGALYNKVKSGMVLADQINVHKKLSEHIVANATSKDAASLTAQANRILDLKDKFISDYRERVRLTDGKNLDETRRIYEKFRSEYAKPNPFISKDKDNVTIMNQQALISRNKAEMNRIQAESKRQNLKRKLAEEPEFALAEPCVLQQEYSSYQCYLDKI